MSTKRRNLRIGIDIGGTKTLIALLNEAGDVLKVSKFDTDKTKGYDYIVERIVRELKNILSEGGASGEIERIGVACAGQIDQREGVVRFSPNLAWRDVNLKEDLERRTKIKVLVENDVNAATYGEWLFSFGGKPENVIGVWIGTGVGGGIILRKRLYRGSLGFAGEIGHMILNPYGYRCNCGSRGCFEAFCGGSYIIERVERLMRRGYRGKIKDIVEERGSLTVREIEKAYEFGDQFLREIWEEVIEYLGCGLTSLANIFDPDLIILGGGVIENTRNLLKLAKRVFEKKVMGQTRRRIEIAVSNLKELSAVKGVSFIDES